MVLRGSGDHPPVSSTTYRAASHPPQLGGAGATTVSRSRSRKSYNGLGAGKKVSLTKTRYIKLKSCSMNRMCPLCSVHYGVRSGSSSLCKDAGAKHTILHIKLPIYKDKSLVERVVWCLEQPLPEALLLSGALHFHWTINLNLSGF